MKKHEYEVWAALTNSDTTEGRGYEIVIGYFTHRTDAEKAAKGKGVMGTDGGVEKRRVRLVIHDTYAEFMATKRSKLREQALAKLDPDELEALGLTDN